MKTILRYILFIPIVVFMLIGGIGIVFLILGEKLGRKVDLL